MTNLLPHTGADPLAIALGLLVTTDFCLLGAERRRLCIRLITLQGLILGFMPLLARTGAIDARLVATTMLFLAVKAVFLPLLLRHTYKKLPITPPLSPYLGNAVSMLAGLLGFAFSLWLASRLGAAVNQRFFLFFPAAFATIFTGLLLIVTRRLAFSQMFGYLVLENGIYLLGVPMTQRGAFWLELSVLMDILLAAFVMGMALTHINRVFDSTDVERFVSLRD